MRQIKINATTGNEILTAQNVKDYVRVDTSADDNLITSMITQARIWCENYISRDIVFDLPFGPVASVSEITLNGTITTDYEILGLDNETIELDGGIAERVKITYITLGINDSLVKQAMLQLISTYYDNRADFTTEQNDVGEIPTSTRNILNSYKVMFL